MEAILTTYCVMVGAIKMHRTDECCRGNEALES